MSMGKTPERTHPPTNSADQARMCLSGYPVGYFPFSAPIRHIVRQLDPQGCILICPFSPVKATRCDFEHKDKAAVVFDVSLMRC